MQVKAAVARESNKLTIETVELDPPKAGELLVKIHSAGVCHSDLHTYQGELRVKPPLVLGHEGAGVVEAVGEGVSRIKVGDRILVNWLPACESCTMCLTGHHNLCERLPGTTFAGALLDGTSRLHTLDGLPLKQYLSASTMAEYVVISEPSAVAFPDDVPFEVAAIIGCAVMTGVGAVVNTGQAKAGSSAAVIGCGGIGLSMIQGCKLAGCYPIIAVDVMDSKLEFARQLGATDTINAKEVDVVAALREAVHNGPEFVFDSVGAAATISQSLQAVRPGGSAVIAGLHAALEDVPIPAAALILQNKRLLGSFVGSSNPLIDLPILVNLYRAGKLQLDEMISKRYPLEALPQAFSDMVEGNVARGVLMFD